MAEFVQSRSGSESSIEVGNIDDKAIQTCSVGKHNGAHEVIAEAQGACQAKGWSKSPLQHQSPLISAPSEKSKVTESQWHSLLTNEERIYYGKKP